MEQPQSRESVSGQIQRLFKWLDYHEVPLVELAAQSYNRRPFALLLRAVNWMYDGWIYLILIPAVAASRNWRLLLAGILSGSMAYAVFYGIKPRFRRLRPCDLHEDLISQGRCLDQYSFPSGHCMTFAATSVPLAWTYHALIPLIASIFLLLGWARMAAAHHYATDVLLGALTGTAIALPITLYVLP